MIARTRRQLSVEVPLTQTVQVPTEETVVRKKLELFGLELPLTLNPEPGGGVRGGGGEGTGPSFRE